MDFFKARNNLTTILVFIFLITIQGCSQASSNQESSFSVYVGNDLNILELSEVKVEATLSKKINSIKMLWRQLEGGVVEIESPESSVLVFVAPIVPAGETEHRLTFSFVAIDENGSEAKDNITIIINKTPAPVEADAGENQVVFALDNVRIQGHSLHGMQGIVQTSWQQISGSKVSIASPFSVTTSFIAPDVDVQETIALTFTITNEFGLSYSDGIEILVNPKMKPIPAHVLLFTEQRISNVKQKINEDDTAWLALTSKISHYYEKIPYNAGEYAGAFALAYYISGEKKYIERAIELLNHAYFDDTDIGWKDYSSRNLFRINARWAVMGYSWIKDFISLQEQARIENILKLWSEYWLKHVDFDNDFKALRIADTDDITSITKNLTLLGYVLSESNIHHDFGEKVLDAGDILLKRYVVGYYMEDIMKGGAWAEGSDYSTGTQRHWIETFIINKDQRSIEFPINYAETALESFLHQTLSGGTGVYKYGSEENAIDYDELSSDYRYEFALALMSILENENDLALIHQWFNRIIDKQGFKSGSLVTHFDRLLYHHPSLSTVPPQSDLNTFHYAQGVGLIASRDNWHGKATNLYFINRKVRVDHEHKDALSFDIARNGVWITKEATGYGGASESSRAHNTILIENAADGSSNPTRRPAGDPKYHSMYNDEYVTLISADATETYNMTGYYATNYAQQVNRQIAFIKPNIVIIYDHTITDQNQIRDLSHYSDLNLLEGMQHTRWVKLIQHVQAEPSIIENRHNSYQVEAEDHRLAYQVISPVNATVNVIDEKELWQDSFEYNMPENQRKWHFEVSTAIPTQENEFITSLSFGADAETTIDQLLLDPIVMTQENSYIVTGNITGVAINTQKNKYIILFNKTPEQAVNEVKIRKPPGFEEALVYSIGFEMNDL